MWIATPLMSQALVVDCYPSSMDVPDLSFAPVRIHQIDETRLLVVGCDGELQILSSNTLESESQAVRPFPSPLTKSIVRGEHLFAFWVEHDLLAARMACLDLSEDLIEGASKSMVRSTMNLGEHATAVAGAKWSQVLNAEPLAICADDGKINFALWKRGIYCITPNTNELWRQPVIEWDEIGDLPRGQELIALKSTGEEIIAWTRGGGWAVLDSEDGELKSQGAIEVPAALSGIYHSPKGGWLLCSTNGHIIRFDELGGETIVIDVGGPVNYATWDESEDAWRLCGWREDLLWSSSGLQRSDRAELGIHTMLHNEKWVVLDNTGKWSNFKT